MVDRENVIKSLETCSDVYYGATGACSSCSFSQSKNCFAELVHQTIALLKEQEEREKAICKEICDFIRGACSTDTDDDKDFVCYEIQRIFIRS